MRLTGKTALVTGGASGIGLATGLRFAEEGADTWLLDLNQAALSTAADGAGVHLVAADITDEAALSAAFAQVPRLDVLVANAGVQLIGHDAAVTELDLDVWQRTLAVNATGTMLTLKYGVAKMLESGGGSVIVTGSPTGLTGEGRGFTAYSATKALVHGLTRTVAADYAHLGVRVNAVVPGFTETPLVASLAGDPSNREQVVGRIPLGRAGTPDDVTGVMVFLASDESSYATGGLFVVDGGMTTL